MIIVATATVIIKLYVENNNGKKVTWFGAITSWIFALCISYIVYPIAERYFEEWFKPAAIAMAVLCGEKVVTYIMYRFDVEKFIIRKFNLGKDEKDNS